LGWSGSLAQHHRFREMLGARFQVRGYPTTLLLNGQGQEARACQRRMNSLQTARQSPSRFEGE